MKLNDIKTLWEDAPLNGKDVSWEFITEDLDNLYGKTAMSADGTKIAIYEGNHLVELTVSSSLKSNVIKVWSDNDDARRVVANTIAGWMNDDKESDLYAYVKYELVTKVVRDRERHQSVAVPTTPQTTIFLYHTNTEMLKCRYKVKVDGKNYEGEFFLDMLNPEIYDGIHYGIEGCDDFPNEHIFGHLFSTDGSDGNTGDVGVEIQVRLNAEVERIEVTEAVAYLWRNNREEDIIENYDTIDAEIEIINIENNETIY